MRNSTHSRPHNNIIQEKILRALCPYHFTTMRPILIRFAAACTPILTFSSGVASCDMCDPPSYSSRPLFFTTRALSEVVAASSDVWLSARTGIVPRRHHLKVAGTSVLADGAEPGIVTSSASQTDALPRHRKDDALGNGVVS